MAASDNRSSSSLSMSALVSSAIGLQAGFSTNCRRHALQAYLALPLWICSFRTTRLEPQLAHFGRGCFSLIHPLYNHYPLITIQFPVQREQIGYLLFPLKRPILQGPTLETLRRSCKRDKGHPF